LPTAKDEVVNVAFACKFKFTGGPSWVVPSRKVTVPVGVPVPVGVTVAAKVTDCPNVEGFSDDVTAADVALPVEAIGWPTRAMEKGLPGALVVTNILPSVCAVPPTKTSFVGTKETLIVQLVPGVRLAGHVFVSEKFSDARIPAIVKAVSPTLLKVTDCDGLVVLIAWAPKVRLAGVALATGPVTPVPLNPIAAEPPAAFVVTVNVPPVYPAVTGANLIA